MTSMDAPAQFPKHTKNSQGKRRHTHIVVTPTTANTLKAELKQIV
jgi:hypothetical protein